MTTPSSKAHGASSFGRCGLVTRSRGPRISRKLPGSSSPATRWRARRLVEAVGGAKTVGRGAHAASPSNSSTAWSRRRLTTAGVAPASLIVTSTSRERVARSEVGEHRAPRVAESHGRCVDDDTHAAAEVRLLDQDLEIARGNDAGESMLRRARVAFLPLNSNCSCSMSPPSSPESIEFRSATSS